MERKKECISFKLNFRWRKTLDKWQHSWPLNGRKFADRSYDRWGRPFFKILYSREKLYSNFLVSQTISVLFRIQFHSSMKPFPLSGWREDSIFREIQDNKFFVKLIPLLLLMTNWIRYCALLLWHPFTFSKFLYGIYTYSFKNFYMTTSTFFPKNYKAHRKTRSHLKRISVAAFTKNRIPKQHHRIRIA